MATSNHIIFSYLHPEGGHECSFDFDTRDSTHQRRIISMFQWAAKAGVEIYCNPKQNIEQANKRLTFND